MQGWTPAVACEAMNQASWKCDQVSEGDVPIARKRAAADGGVTLHILDRDTKDYMQTAHDEALQPMDMRLQQHSTFCAIEQCGDDDRTENAKLCLRADFLLVPEDTTETAKGLRGLADPGVDLQVRATVLLNVTSQILESGDRFNRGMVGEEMDGNRWCTMTGWENCHGLGL